MPKFKKPNTNFTQKQNMQEKHGDKRFTETIHKGQRTMHMKKVYKRIVL